MKTKKVKKYRVLISAPYMQTEINKLRPVFKERNISIDLPKVHERLSEKELIDI
ncbi:MAG: hypothetical protein JKZ03_00390 [Flavobacteriaceae bacterium]|nr:hypothetical protein [Flavobacteriaceae bacterium]